MFHTILSSLLSSAARAQPIDFGGCEDPDTRQLIPSIYAPVPDIAIAANDPLGRPVIYANNQILAGSFPKLFVEFTYAHECGHHTLRHLKTGQRQNAEIDADCWAASLLSSKGVLTKENFDDLATSMTMFFSEDPTHPSAQKRISHILNYCVNFDTESETLPASFSDEYEPESSAIWSYDESLEVYNEKPRVKPRAVAPLPEPVINNFENTNSVLENLLRVKSEEIKADPNAYFTKVENYLISETREFCLDDFYFCYENRQTLSLPTSRFMLRYVNHEQFDRAETFLKNSLMPKNPALANLSLLQLYILQQFKNPSVDYSLQIELHFQTSLQAQPEGILPIMVLIDNSTLLKKSMTAKLLLASVNRFETTLNSPSAKRYGTRDITYENYRNAINLLGKLAVDGSVDNTAASQAMDSFFAANFDRDFESNPASEDYTYFLRAMLAIKSNNVMKAISHLTKAIELDPNDPDNFLGFALYYAQKNDATMANMYIYKAIEGYEKNPFSRYFLQSFSFAEFPQLQTLADSDPTFATQLSKLKTFSIPTK